MRSELWLSLVLLAACAEGGTSEDGMRADGGPVDGSTEDAGRVDGGRTDGGGGTGSCAREGDPCDADGDGCTEDICRGGICVGGAERSCDDGVACTDASCRSTGATTFECSHVVAAGQCLTEGVCRDDGERDPAESCRVCDTALSQTLWSAAVGACDDGDACTVDDVCSDGVCAGQVRQDTYEDNDTRAQAAGFPNVSDGDSYPAGSAQATLYPDDDVDWFVFNDSDDFLGSIYPTADITGVPSGSDFDLCVFVDCESSFLDLTCTAGSRTSRGGLTGCCSRNGAGADENVRIDHECSGTDDSADIYIEVTRVAGPATCDAPYTLQYGDS